MKARYRRYARFLIQLFREELGDPAVGCEVGVWRGETSEMLLREFPSLFLYLIDPWELGGGSPLSRRRLGGRKAMAAARLACEERTGFAARRRSMLQMTSAEAAPKFYDAALDFVYIDGDHSYDAVRHDVRAWWPKLRAGGLLSGHDYGGMGDRTGRFGVKRAVDEWAGEAGLDVRRLPALLWCVKKGEEEER